MAIISCGKSNMIIIVDFLILASLIMNYRDSPSLQLLYQSIALPKGYQMVLKHWQKITGHYGFE